MGFLYGYVQYFEVHNFTVSSAQAFANWLNIIDGGITAVPLVLFICFYWLGKRTDVVTNLKTVLISLLPRSAIGYFIGFGPFAYLFITPSGPNMNILYSFVLSGVLSIFGCRFVLGLQLSLLDTY
jgi:hypothetical protein